MSSVRVLVGTAKGAFILSSDGTRVNWNIEGPLFAGWTIYHMKGSPVDPNRIYASQCSDWFGQVIQRSSDGGQTWEQPSGGVTVEPATGMPIGASNKFIYEGNPGTHMWYDGTPHPWEFKRIWHLEPSHTDMDVVYAGAEDAALFRSIDGAVTWNELPGLRDQRGGEWQPRAGGLGLHTILLDPNNPQRIYVAISAAGAFRTDDGGTSWKPINRGLKSKYIPDPNAEIGRSPDTAMTKTAIRVVMPYHLQNLAQVGPEITLEIEGPVSPSSVLDAIEVRYPMLRGTIRDHVTKKRRPLLRYFACEKDLSHEPPEAPLPEAILSGAEPFIIWGAVAGG